MDPNMDNERTATLLRWKLAVHWLITAAEADIDQCLLAHAGDHRWQLNFLLATAAMCERQQ
jgi:hypothetical protein